MAPLMIKKPHPNDVLHGMEVLQALRARNVPVIGSTWPHGVERGALIVTQDDFGDTQWTWQADEPAGAGTVEMRMSVEGWPTNEIDLGFDLIARLAKARVPFVGNIWPRSIERGTLALTRDDIFGEYVWTWRR